jgi:hypothetical protein
MLAATAFIHETYTMARAWANGFYTNLQTNLTCLVLQTDAVHSQEAEEIIHTAYMTSQWKILLLLYTLHFTTIEYQCLN